VEALSESGDRCGTDLGVIPAEELQGWQAAARRTITARSADCFAVNYTILVV